MTNRRTAGEAYAHAESALAEIASHERVCAERYQGIFDTLKDLKADSKDQHKLLWSILASVSGFLAVTLVAVVLYSLKLVG